jgi:predicted Zn-dependent protease
MADRARYMEAVLAFEHVAAPGSARQAFSAAIQTWPGDPLGWVGRGTANYRDHRLAEAAADYRHALERDPGLPGARNNLAQTLVDMHCAAAARAQLGLIDDATLSTSLRAAVSDTRAQLAALPRQVDPPQCGAP